MPGAAIYTYHCLCSELVFATFSPLPNLPKRKGDGAAICKVTNAEPKLPIPGAVVLSGTTIHNDSNPTVLRLEDGFEKRYSVHCRRCDLQVGYHLDKAQFGETESGMRSDVLYILAGSLKSTDDMKKGNLTSQEAEDQIAEADWVAEG